MNCHDYCMHNGDHFDINIRNFDRLLPPHQYFRRSRYALTLFRSFFRCISAPKAKTFNGIDSLSCCAGTFISKGEEAL